MGLETETRNRKARRKEERISKKKKKRRLDPVIVDDEPIAPVVEKKTNKDIPKKENISKDKSSKEKINTSHSDSYLNFDPNVAASLRNDDLEIAELEGQLGLGNEKERKKLHREFSKLEGYGDDFGCFLDDLDQLSGRLSASDTQQESKSENATKGKTKEDKYTPLDPDVASAMRRDDEEIAELESKLGGEKERKKLYREYSKLEGYGDDFGNFLDDLDNLSERVSGAGPSKTSTHNESENSEEFSDSGYASSDGEDIVPMKGPSEDLDEDDSLLDEIDDEDVHMQTRIEQEDDSASETSEDTASDSRDNDDGSDPSDSEGGNNEEQMADHAVQDTYQPLDGENIYGKVTDASKQNEPPKKYVPPHLRKKQEVDEDTSRLESLRTIQRSLNNVLNRLAEGTMMSVAQSISKIYESNPTADVNDCIWKNLLDACVETPMLMTGLIPVYVACIAGAHIHTGDQVQLAGFILEKAVTKLWSELSSARKQHENTNTVDNEIANKAPSNLVLIICYLYNYNLAHCTFLYDVIRHLIKHFSELDVEVLLLILSHCGYSLRSDDPSALKEIVMLVQNRALEAQKEDKTGVASSSRVLYMISAISDLKNNKKKKQDVALGEKTAKFRKLLGRIKSTVAATGVVRSSDSNLRITLNDILSVEKRGRWWKVGASWVGNQYQNNSDDESGSDNDASSNRTGSTADPNANEALLQLASKHRMNTDIRRSIFCIIMGSADCEDAFEKLVRGGMLKNRPERETVRVLVECCGNEKAHNPFYSHLAARICEYQPQCKFTFQLAFWDLFKQFDTIKMRKAANLAKLLFYLVVEQQSLKLSVLKVIDMSEEMTETAGIFLTVFFSTIFDAVDNSAQVKQLFDSGIPRGPGSVPMGSNKAEEGEEQRADDSGLRESLSIFFLQTLKSSPKNKKKSKFRANYKAAVKACETDNIV